MRLDIKRLKAERVAKGLSQEEMASKNGVEIKNTLC